MKKIYNLLIIIIFLPLLYSCGYTPIFSSQNVEIKFISQVYEGDVSLGADIYSKLAVGFPLFSQVFIPPSK